jgi:type IV pilus assembly protein PilX
MKPLRSLRPQTRQPTPQRGVVLIMALIMLAIIGLTSSLALKSVTLGDQIGYNLRNNKNTQQAAEAALRWCEIQVLTRNPALPVQPESTTPNAPNSESWQALANWANATPVPAAVVVGLGSQTNLPRCLAQTLSLGSIGEDRTAIDLQRASGLPIRIAVRAFSSDFTRTNGVSAGGEVWITSTLVFNY